MASIVDISVKHAYSSMTGAPAISGTAGSLIAALDAFLVTGWGSKVVDSAVISNGVCRLTFASGKSAAEKHAVIQVSGANQAAINGEQRVTAVASGWVEFRTALPDGPVTGSISFKMAALGWEKVFGDTSKAVYRPTDVRSTRPYLRVDDTNALFARVQLFESMSDVDTGMGAAPSIASGYYWHKRQGSGSNGYWVLIGDSRGFYYCPAPASGAIASNSGGFAVVPQYAGDLKSYRSGDAWCAAITGATTNVYSDTGGDPFQSGVLAARSIQRASHGIGGAITCEKMAWGAGGISGLAGGMGPFPSPADNGIRLSPILLADGLIDAKGPRGELPGAYHCPQRDVAGVLTSKLGYRDGDGDFVGRVLMYLWVGSPSTASGQGVGFFDASGNWRS